MIADNLEGLARALFDEAGDALFLFDPDTDALVDVNARAEKLSGFPRRELLTFPATYLFRFGGKGGKQRMHDASTKSGVFHSQEGYFLRTDVDGVWLPVNLTISRLHLKPKTLALITARDVRERHEANVRLEQAEAEMRRVLASVSDCVWSADVDAQGRWAYRLISPVIETITGRPPTFFEKPEHWGGVIHPDDLARARASYARAHDGDPVHEEYRILRPDGSIRWVRDSVRVTRGPSANGAPPPFRLDGVLTDITVQREVEEALRREEELLHALIENVPDSIYFKDRKSRFLRISRALAARLGLRNPDDAIGKTDFDFFSEEHARPAFDDEQEVMRTGQPLVGKEEKETWADGRVRWVLTTKMPLHGRDGVIVGTFGLSRDITKRKQAEEERARLLEAEQQSRRRLEVALGSLRQSEARFRSLFESSIIGVMVCTLDGSITDANDALLSMIGYERTELPLRWDLQLTPPEYRARDERAVEQLRRDRVVHPFEKEYIRKDGTRIPVLLGVAMLEATAEQCVCFVLDMIERNRMRSMLVQTEKLASIGLLSAGIAHEINNPLAYVANNQAVLDHDLKGVMKLLELHVNALPQLETIDPATAQCARALAEEIDLPYIRENLDRLLARTRDGVQRIARIVQSLRGMARADQREMEEVQVHDLVEMSLEMVRGWLKRDNIRVELDHRQAPRFRCAATQISQVLLNLMVNAIQAIEAQPGVEGVIRILTRPLGKEMQIQVADNGCGIPPEDLARIFDPFFTRKPVGEGTGLGLSISHGIVTGHGGRIEVDSTAGLGSVFRVYLPLKPKKES